ncbi:hypothetical protein PHSC3_000541 [Chlamydiales bacterium STE3]|nr:hypothetical protein PHSC3_000541 [Chlamydiales bacterium STE3]
MKNVFSWAILMAILVAPIYPAQLMHRALTTTDQEKKVFLWEEKLLNPFDELIVSWDAKRPEQGSYLIRVSLLIKEWSPWLDYAIWSPDDQRTFKNSLPNANVQVYQDAVEVLNGNKATGFRVWVVARGDVALEQFETLHISATNRATQTVAGPDSKNISINLDVAGLSQMTLPDERYLRLCSPTSTTAALRFLLGSLELSPIAFADKVVDSAFDIYGNWILNTAQAFHELGNPWHCYVARLNSFSQIIDQLNKGFPVVVSVKGPLKGSALPYESGHLLVVKGYDSATNEVFCMDPAFANDESTLVKYELNDFMEAWRRKLGIAYIFDQ